MRRRMTMMNRGWIASLSITSHGIGECTRRRIDIIEFTTRTCQTIDDIGCVACLNDDDDDDDNNNNTCDQKRRTYGRTIQIGCITIDEDMRGTREKLDDGPWLIATTRTEQISASKKGIVTLGFVVFTEEARVE
jgi:hypothetical protein